MEYVEAGHKNQAAWCSGDRSPADYGGEQKDGGDESPSSDSHMVEALLEKSQGGIQEGKQDTSVGG